MTLGVRDWSKKVAYRQNSVVEDVFPLLQTLLDFGVLVWNILRLNRADDALFEEEVENELEESAKHSRKQHQPEISKIPHRHVAFGGEGAEVDHRFDERVDHQVGDESKQQLGNESHLLPLLG